MTIVTEKRQHCEIHSPLTYDSYVDKLEELVAKKETSGPDQSEEKINATNINLQRMKRLIKSTRIDQNLLNEIKNLEHNLTWIVITEAWCGDAAQNLPIISKIASLSNNKIELKLVFRDENHSLMDDFLTNGSRSIPKLICINPKTNEVLGSWGPRPVSIQQMLTRYKSESPQLSHKELMYQLHLNYFHDKGISIQAELSKLLNDCKTVLANS